MAQITISEARKRALYIAGSCLAGFASLLYQNYCIHVLFMFFPLSSQLVSLAIGSFLAGLGLSAVLIGHWVRDRQERAKTAILATQLAILAYAFFIGADIEFFPRALAFINAAPFGNGLRATLSQGLIIQFLFIPALCMGGAFPVFNGLYVHSLESVTADTGKIYFWDIVGSVAGCLVTGYVLIPYLGIRPTILLAMTASLLIIVLTDPASRRTLFMALMTGGLLWGHEYFFYKPGLRLHEGIEQDRSVAKANFQFSADQRFSAGIFGQIMFQKESPYGTVTVGKSGNEYGLYINLRGMCLTSKSAQSEVLMGSIAADNAGGHGSLLNIGLGCGKTARAILDHQNIDRLRIEEINPVVAEAQKQIFEPLYPLRSDARTRIDIDDGARFLRETNEMFDGIVIDIEEVDIIYSSPLYTLEYMNLAKEHLRPGGTFVLWSFNPNPEFSKVLYNTVKTVFPKTEMLITQRESFYVVLLGSDSEIKIAPSVDIDRRAVDRIKGNSADLVNTLEKQVLQRYYNPRDIFTFPPDYRERFMTDDKPSP